MLKGQQFLENKLSYAYTGQRASKMSFRQVAGDWSVSEEGRGLASVIGVAWQPCW